MRSSPPVGPSRTVKLDRDALVEVAEACSNDDARPVLTCVSVQPEGIAATDSYRLYVRKVAVGDLPKMLLPANGIRLLPKFTDPEYSWVTGKPDSWLVVTDAEHTLAIRSDGGSYPDWVKLLWEDEGDQHIRFDDLTALAALPTNEMGLTLEPAGDRIAMTLAPSGPSDKAPPVVTGHMAGEATTKVCFNPKFLRALLKGVDRTEIRGTDRYAALAESRSQRGAAQAPWKLEEDAPGGKRIRILMPVYQYNYTAKPSST